MKEPPCRQCQYFHQHYIVDDVRCMTVRCGHCAYPRLKHRKPDTCACIHVSETEEAAPLPDRPGVIHFLTVDMLEHILNLKLPPVVEKTEK